MLKLFVKIFKNDSSRIFEMKFLFHRCHEFLHHFYFLWLFFSSFFKIIKLFFKFERIQRVVEQITKNEMLIIKTAITFDVNRNTLLNRVNKKRLSIIDYDKKCRLLNEAEKSALLLFIDKYCKLDFSSKYKMIKDKIMKLRAFRVKNFESIKFHWVSRFLNRHFYYKFRFFRHLKQKRHWNTEFKIFENWFNLY